MTIVYIYVTGAIYKKIKLLKDLKSGKNLVDIVLVKNYEIKRYIEPESDNEEIDHGPVNIGVDRKREQKLKQQE